MAGQTYFWDWTHGRRLYLDRLLDALAADPEAAAGGFFFDVVPYHLYFNPTQAPQVIGEVKAALARRGITGKEIWINETNAPPSDDPQEPPWSAPRYRISLDEQAAFVIQQFSQAFAAGASRVEIYKLRNSADHPESIEPFGLLRADDSRRPAFDAYRAVTTYLRDFKGVVKQQLGDVVAFTFDRGGQTTTVLWTWGRTPARVRVKAIAPEGLLVDERGRTSTIKPADGSYVIELPGATCSDAARLHARHRRRAAAARGSWRGGWPGRAHPAADTDGDAHPHAHLRRQRARQPPARRRPQARRSRRRHRRPPPPKPPRLPPPRSLRRQLVAAATVTAGATSVATPPATPPAASGRGPISVCAIPIGASVLAVGLVASRAARRAVSSHPKR